MIQRTTPSFSIYAALTEAWVKEWMAANPSQVDP